MAEHRSLLDYFRDGVSGDRGYGPETAILFDLDETLVRTKSIEHLRRPGRWPEALEALSQTSLPPLTREFVALARQVGGVGVVTSSPRIYAEALLAYHGLEIPVLVAFHDVDRHKPWPDPILKAAELSHIPVEGCLYIGDKADDLRAADAAGVASIGLNWESISQLESVGGMTLGCCGDWEGVYGMFAPPGIPLTDENVVTALDYGDHLDLRWEGDDFAILKYTPRALGYTHASTLIHDYKDNTPADVKMINRFAVRAIERMESELRDERRCQYIVGIPGHDPGPCKAHVRSTCRAIVDQFEWLQDGTDWLERTASVPSSARAAAGQRPSLQAHIRTMTYTGPPRSHLPRDASIIMVDDVITVGTTSSAARQILKDAGYGSVVGLFMARTVHWRSASGSVLPRTDTARRLRRNTRW